jgi:dynein assembly factor 1
MELFPDLKTLYFESNGCDEISGLESNTELRCLYMHENCITKMAGLDNLTRLSNLNLSDNLIDTVEGISNLEFLDVLYLARNRIGRNGLDDLRGLLDCPSLTTVDLQNNKIEDPECLEEIFAKMPNLKVLYLQGNKCTNMIKNYRKTMIARIPTLKYLDDRPVFEDDRRNSEAFHRGGIDAERAEREVIHQEKVTRDEKNRTAFKDMIKKARAEKAEADEIAEAEKAAAEIVEAEKAEAERSASPADGAQNAEDDDGTEKIKTVEEVENTEDDAPPELE